MRLVCISDTHSLHEKMPKIPDLPTGRVRINPRFEFFRFSLAANLQEYGF